ncbi:hypothetical protein [Thalassotalea sp. ND16A]|nr:hypothetical protein [Thalassotalea sp. ND16A]KGJ98555.1 hypothetical protein ND16A_0625 [Thalassotalea sp. ND16A]
MKAQLSLDKLLAVEPDSHHKLLLGLYHDAEFGLKDEMSTCLSFDTSP